MEKIAFIIGEQFLYWSPLILAIAVVAALCAFVALHLGTGGKTLGTFLVLPLSLVLGLLLGRLIHWYCRPDAYESLSAAMSDFTGGSYALTGVAAGVLASLGIARLLRALDNLPKALDCASLAGMLGICVGRFNHMFNANDRGQVVTTITELPLVYPVENTITGELEYRFAAFMVQAIVAGTLFAVLPSISSVRAERSCVTAIPACWSLCATAQARCCWTAPVTILCSCAATALSALFRCSVHWHWDWSAYCSLCGWSSAMASSGGTLPCGWSSVHWWDWAAIWSTMCSATAIRRYLPIAA